MIDLNKKCSVTLSIIIGFLCLFSFCEAQTFSVQVIDEITNKGIPFASIKTGGATGVITNEDGYFNININTENTIEISCLGYENLIITIDAVKLNKNKIALKQFVDELNEVYLSNDVIDVNSIIDTVLLNRSKNYKYDYLKHSIFCRSKTSFKFKNLDFKIKNASGFRRSKLTKVNKSLDSMVNIVKSSKSKHYTDYYGDLIVSTLR